MRHGYNAALVFTGSGNLVAFGTGSEACTEHECGSRELQEALSNAFADESDIIKALRAGKKVTEYPSVVDRKRISKNLDNIQFIEVQGRGDEEPQAILGYVNKGTDLMYSKSQLEFPHFQSSADMNVSGAWEASSFAIRVRGKKYVKALKGFYDAMKAGHVLFAGSFLANASASERLSGVIMADSRYLSDETRASMAKAQVDYESGMRLKAQDDSVAVMDEMRKLSGMSTFNHVWALWKDTEESGVIYGLNPGYESQADYYGPYTREQLLDWAKAKFKYHLSRETEPKATAAA